MSIIELMEKGKFVITAEVGPPKGTDIKEILETAEMMHGRLTRHTPNRSCQRPGRNKKHF